MKFAEIYILKKNSITFTSKKEQKYHDKTTRMMKSLRNK